MPGYSDLKFIDSLSKIIPDYVCRNIQQHNPLRPGAFTKRVYLEPFEIGSNDLAGKLQVSAELVSRLINGKTDVSLNVDPDHT